MYEYESKNFSKQLAILISDSDKTLSEIAIEIAMDHTALYRYVNQKRIPTLQNFVKLANYFKCTSAYLLGQENVYYEYAFREIPPFSKQFKMILKKYEDNPNHIKQICGVSDSAMYAWLKGKKIPLINNVATLADYFKISVDDFIGR